MAKLKTRDFKKFPAKANSLNASITSVVGGKKYSIAKYRYYIGIDTGVNTGIAIWDRVDKKFTAIGSMSIHKALKTVEGFEKWRGDMFVRVEDARLRKMFGRSGRERLQGAGSIKRDAKIWEDFLTDIKMEFELVAPRHNVTKLNAQAFKKLTKWTGVTNEHGRDAAMLVFGK